MDVVRCGLSAGVSAFDLHPDGERFAVLMAVEDQVEQKRDKVVLILNFFELLRQELGSQ